MELQKAKIRVFTQIPILCIFFRPAGRKNIQKTQSTILTTSKEHHKFEQLVQKLDPQSKLLRAWELKGGVSAQVTALEIERPDGQTQKMIVRRHGAVDLQQNPQIAADEFKLLQITQSAGLATPAPYYVDLSGEIF